MFEQLQKVQRLEFIREMCTGKKVLHLGCTNYPYTEKSLAEGMLVHSWLRDVSKELHGIDSDSLGLKILETNGFENLFLADLENLDSLDIDAEFDVIVAGEIIEHLNNPGLFLSGIQRFMRQNTRLLITTVNAYCATRFALYARKSDRGISEPVHPDHVAYYSYSTLSLLIKRHELKIEKFCYYDIGTEHRPFNKWFVNLFNDICVKVRPQVADGLIAVCRLDGDGT